MYYRCMIRFVLLPLSAAGKKIIVKRSILITSGSYGVRKGKIYFKCLFHRNSSNEVYINKEVASRTFYEWHNLSTN